MSAQNLSGAQFRQLSMVHKNRYGEERAHSYVPVREIAERWDHDEGPLSRKLTQSYEPENPGQPNSSLYSSIKRAGGVSTPVQVDSLWHDLDTPMDHHVLNDGHHRVAALYDQNPDAQIPVIWRAGGGGDPYNRR